MKGIAEKVGPVWEEEDFLASGLVDDSLKTRSTALVSVLTTRDPLYDTQLSRASRSEPAYSSVTPSPATGKPQLA